MKAWAFRSLVVSGSFLLCAMLAIADSTDDNKEEKKAEEPSKLDTALAIAKERQKPLLVFASPSG